MTRSERVYRALLRVYPARTRDASGDDMTQLFIDRLRDTTSGRELAVLWLETIADVAATAPREHLAARRSRELVEGPGIEPARVPMKRDAALCSLPLLASLALLAVGPMGVWGPMHVNSPGIFGLPLDMVILMLLAALASVGLLGARRTRELNDPWWQALILAVVLVPAPALVVVAGPVAASIYAMGVTLLVLVARFKWLMLALVAPFLVWLVAGPVIWAPVLDLLNGIGAASP